MLEGIRAGQSLGGSARLPVRARPARSPRRRRGRHVHLQAAPGLPAPRGPAEVHEVARGRLHRADRGPQRDRRPRPGRTPAEDAATRYPFGKAGLPHGQPRRRLRPSRPKPTACSTTHDAVADLALSEGVYQAVLGNYDRVASTYDAYARGNFPPEPDVIRTPLNGIGLTLAVALHLEAGAAPTVSPIAGLPMTPRAQGEPAVNRWLAAAAAARSDRLLRRVSRGGHRRDGHAGDHAAAARSAAGRSGDARRDDDAQTMTEIDDRVVRFTVAKSARGPTSRSASATWKEALRPSACSRCCRFRALRRLVTRARPLRPTDLALREATVAQDIAPTVDGARLASCAPRSAS